MATVVLLIREHHDNMTTPHNKTACLERGGVPWSAATTVIWKESSDWRADVEVMTPVHRLIEKGAC